MISILHDNTEKIHTESKARNVGFISAMIILVEHLHSAPCCMSDAEWEGRIFEVSSKTAVESIKDEYSFVR